MDTQKDPQEPKMAAPKDEVKKQYPRSRKKMVWIFVFVLVGIFVALCAYTGIMLYGFNSKDRVTTTVATVLPFPVALVNNELVWYKDFAMQLRTLEHYSQKQESVGVPIIPVPEGKEMAGVVLDRLVKREVTEQYAKELGVTVSKEDIDKEFEKFVSEESGGVEKIEKSLMDLYLWTIEDFKNEIVREFVLRDKLFSQIIKTDSNLDADRRKKAEEALAVVQKGEKSFEDVAKDFSEDPTNASLGGDLGVFRLGDMAEEFSSAVAALKEGEVSGVVRTKYGFHIIKLEKIIPGGSPEETQYSAKHILILGTPLDEILNERVQKAKVKKLL